MREPIRKGKKTRRSVCRFTVFAVQAVEDA
jgi:hypothetical protein